MEPEEELCMQAYLVGNGYYKLHCCLFLSSGLLLPWIWIALVAHYKLGKRRDSLSSLSLGGCMNERTEVVIRKYRAAAVAFSPCIAPVAIFPLNPVPDWQSS